MPSDQTFASLHKCQAIFSPLKELWFNVHNKACASSVGWCATPWMGVSSVKLPRILTALRYTLCLTLQLLVLWRLSDLPPVPASTVFSQHYREGMNLMSVGSEPCLIMCGLFFFLVCVLNVDHAWHKNVFVFRPPLYNSVSSKNVSFLCQRTFCVYMQEFENDAVFM